MKQKFIQISKKCPSYKLISPSPEHHYTLSQFRSESSSSDSDLPSPSSQIHLIYSSLEQKLLCECASVDLYGTPCPHIIKVLSHMREAREGCFSDREYSVTALELDDVQGYVTGG